MRVQSNSPRIAYVTRYWPNQPGSGAQVRSDNVLRALQQIGTVDVVMVEDRSGDLRSNPGGETKSVYCLAVEPRPNKGLREKLRWTFDPGTDYPEGWGVEKNAVRRVLGSLKEFDLIWFFKLRLPHLFPTASWPRSVVDIDDIPSMYEWSAWKVGGGLRQRLLTLRRLYSWRRREKLLGQRYTVLAVCSEEDRQYLGRMGLKAPIHVIPNGFETPSVEPVRSPATPPRIGFIGLFDYFPNSEGIHWFVTTCWPRIKREVPAARLRLAGKGSDGRQKPLGPDIDGLGWLANPSDEIKTWSVMAIPVRLGAGTRVKIAYGFSQRCPIVSTSLGAYGYQVRDGQEMYLGDSPEAFSSACIKAIREPREAAQMAERAWRQFLEKWTWEAIRPRVWTAAEDCLRLSGRS